MWPLPPHVHIFACMYLGKVLCVACVSVKPYLEILIKLLYINSVKLDAIVKYEKN